ncbi:MAG: glycosyltransferase family 2 protein [Stomatobaculum sp.]|nr:glycosyltransferase family 2 protein [Stomatobaculum sp.]
MCVNVILCSRNGEKYLRAQIESILKQTEQSVRLLISDDVSSDRTQEIEREYAEQYPERVRVRFRTVPSGGAARHFFLALQYFAEETGDGSLSPSGQYYMFADQDDIWHPDKVEKTLAAMREAEAAAVSGEAEAAAACTVPLLVHCDMRVVDEEEQEIAPSYVKYQQMSPERCILNQLLVQNNVTGGAMMMNEALVRLILSRPLPRHAVMHDHWIALAAAAFGKVIFLDEALYDYRQHGSNVLGAAKGSRVREVFDRLGLFRKDGKTKKEMDRHSASVYEALFRQAAEFGRQYETPAGRCEEKKDQGTPTVLSPEQRKMILAFVSMRKMNRAQKTATILKYGFTFNRLHRTAGECLFM